MNAARILGVVLIVAGLAAVVWGSFGYDRATHQAKIGPFELSVTERQNIDIPGWAGISSIVLGCALVLWPTRKA